MPFPLPLTGDLYTLCLFLFGGRHLHFEDSVSECSRNVLCLNALRERNATIEASITAFATIAP